MANPITETTPEVREIALENKVDWPSQYPAGPVPVPDSASSMASADLAKLSLAMRSGAPIAPIPAPVRPDVFQAGSVSQASSASQAGSVSQASSISQASSMSPLLKLWLRAPLLTITMGYSTIGILGGVVFAAGSQFLSARAFLAFLTLSQVGLSLWASGFLAMLCYGFYSFVRFTPPTRN